MKHIDAISHVTGQSVFVDDIPVRTGTLYGSVFRSPAAHGRIRSMDLSGALATDGVVRVLTASDIPGVNQVGGIVADEPLFAVDRVTYQGQPVALVVAADERVARKAAKKIRVDIEPLKAVFDAREAFKNELFLVPPSTIRSGNTGAAWDTCRYIFEGQTGTGAQEHVYIETQGTYAFVSEGDNIRIQSSTQGPTHVQETVARVLGLAMHRIEVEVTRLGGGFGGKEDQATAYACMAALASYILKLPVKVILQRTEDMEMTGKRHPYGADYKIGLSGDLKIIAYQAAFYQNGGAAADLSPAILARSLFHATNCYHIPNTEVTAYSCRTNLPPNTAFRGFGGPQGMFVIEAAIAHAARELKVHARVIQEKNFLSEGDQFPYGQVAKQVNITKCSKLADQTFDIDGTMQEVASFNRKHPLQKKGVALMPICFGISFTNRSMNQARALVHIYLDGSVGISTGAVEMGQGVNTKIMQVAARTLSVPVSRIKIETTNTTRVSNTSPTAASSGADLNGKATEIACNRLANRLRKTAATMLDEDVKKISIDNEWVTIDGVRSTLSYADLVKKACNERVCLSEQGHYATPVIGFDKSTGKGHPFAYHVYGIALFVAHVDCLRGTYRFDKVLIVHDFGNSMNTSIDLGQVEGALIQGMGWMTMEEVVFDRDGKLLSNNLSSYKVPDIHSVPRKVTCIPLPVKGPKHAILRSKAVGEPPLMYGIGAYFALQEAIRAFNPGHVPDLIAPMTHEKMLMSLYG